MIVWVIIGVIALASIILGVSLHQAFWTLFGCLAALIIICYVLTEAWDLLGEIGENRRKKQKMPKAEKKQRIPKVVASALSIIGIIIAIIYFIWTF